MVNRVWSGISTTTVSPDATHSFRVFASSVSRRLSGIVLMGMELFSFHNKLVADLAPDKQDHDLVSLDIIQGTQVSRAQLKLAEGVWAQALDRFRECRRLLLQSGQDGRFQNSLLARRQRLELP